MTRLSANQVVWVRQLAAKMPFYKFMGIRLAKLGRGSAKIKVRVGRRLTQQAGFAHGGVAAALIDSAVGLAVCTMIDPRSVIRTIDLQVNFLAPVKPGLLVAQGKIFHKGKQTAVGDCQVTDENGKLVSKGTATYMILENRRLNSQTARPVRES